MRIVNQCETKVEFANIKVGECFLYDNCLFIKMQPDAKPASPYNAFSFVDNTVAGFRDDWHVTPVVAEIIIYSKGAQT